MAEASRRYMAASSLLLLRLLLAIALVVPVGCGVREPAVLKVAVDAGFQPALEALRPGFEANCRCRLQITAGASGILYGQIRAGEGFDLFLSADSARPVLLEKAGLIVPSSRQIYARGQLALWVSRQIATDKSSGYSVLAATQAQDDSALTPRQLILLLGRGQHKLVVADPQLAPDGDAAVKMLKKLRLWPLLKTRMVYAGHAGHAQILLHQGEGQMGLIPYGQALASGNSGQFMRIPTYFYPPIEQQLVILRSSRQRALAIRLLQYLHSEPVQKQISGLGFLGVKPAN
ncbi:molybdate ABC transporter substrate-binding protein [Microbulbifer bruguierae]|uniref:Molybdate ABC transporter substrate-binding protein n=1 Tax=Microbulbifer bruguierae TaxID=3029061 RepID=A0ABY8NBF0_9GAMM|nr:molybdate ABC transporter substrate-binding protein [Microbulbifer bruguierae]WGL16256.1 molybdate ABC transporter substrate-binding protein [Microbulbifer bruguierae]